MLMVGVLARHGRNLCQAFTYLICFSELDYPGQPFWCPEADHAFLEALRKFLCPDIPLEVSEKAMNDSEFSSRVAERLLGLINQE